MQIAERERERELPVFWTFRPISISLLFSPRGNPQFWMTRTGRVRDTACSFNLTVLRWSKGFLSPWPLTRVSRSCARYAPAKFSGQELQNSARVTSRLLPVIGVPFKRVPSPRNWRNSFILYLSHSFLSPLFSFYLSPMSAPRRVSWLSGLITWK